MREYFFFFNDNEDTEQQSKNNSASIQTDHKLKYNNSFLFDNYYTLLLIDFVPSYLEIY